jgi:butyrate kinase
MSRLILSINPGSTSTKIAVYEDETQIFIRTIDHSSDELGRFDKLMDQFEFRKNYVLACLREEGIDMSRLSAVVGRGGLLPPVHGGGYLVNEDMLEELRSGGVRPHASNLGAIIAHSIAAPLGIPAYIYDAVSTDEFYDVAKITGITEVVRQNLCHVLNSKATARKAAKMRGGVYEEKNYIVAHIGGGISISAHKKGRIVDSISDDDGPFSPERAGSVPLGYIINICYHSGLSEKELNDKLKKNSGIKGHLHTNDCREVEKMIAAGNDFAARIYEAQAYQIAKGIWMMASPLCGSIDAIILTGGLAYSEYICAEVSRRVSRLAEIIVMPGENEMEALALGALRILRDEEGCSRYGRPR